MKKLVFALVLLPLALVGLAWLSTTSAAPATTTILIALLGGALGLLVYFLPSLIGKQKRNATAIFMLNLFLGWTLLGWVAALVWACTSDQRERPVA
jgi:NADH:ubiquinone oxidoreductase subunit 6 (subunit J)